MKTKEEFQEIQEDFFANVQWINGGDFMFAVYEFMNKHNFESHILLCLAKTYDGEIIMITDSLQNDVGIVLKVVYGKGKVSFVGSKDNELNKFYQSGTINLTDT